MNEPAEGVAAAEMIAASARACSYAAVSLWLGLPAFALMRGRDPMPRQLRAEIRRLWMLAAVVFAAAQAVKLWAQAAGFVEPGSPVTAADLSLFAFETRWGWGWRAQTIVALLAAPGVALPWGRPAAAWTGAALASAAAASLPLTGHAAAHPGRIASALAIQGAHAIAAGLWRVGSVRKCDLSHF